MSAKNHKVKRKQGKKPSLGVDKSHKIKELEQEKIILQALYDFLYDDKISSDLFMSTISDNLKNTIVPIKVYVDMLLGGCFGNLSEKQKEKLKIIRTSTSNLDKHISDELRSKKL